MQKLKNIVDLLKNIFKKNLFRKTFQVSVFLIGVKCLALLKEVIVVKQLGLSVNLDSFYIAFLLPSFFFNIFLNSFSNLFIPNYLKEKQESRYAFANTTAITFLIITLAVVGLVLFSKNIFLSFYSLSEFKIFLINKNLLILIGAIFFMGERSFFAGILNAHQKFVITSLTPALTVITTICLFLFKPPAIGIYFLLSFSILLGSILEFSVTFFSAYKLKLFRLAKPNFHSPNYMEMIKEMPPKVISSFLTGCSPFVDQSLASKLPTGSISSINYANKIPSFVSSITVTAIGTVILPYFSNLAIDGSTDIKFQLKRIIIFVFSISALAVSLLIFFSHDIVFFLFQRGKFTSADTSLISVMQAVLLIQVPFYTVAIIFVKYLTSINKNRLAAYASIINLILNVVLDLIFMKFYGVIGIVISTSIVVIINCIILGLLTYKCIRQNA